MLKFFKDNIFNIITVVLTPFLLWVFKEHIPDTWTDFIIPLKINIFLITLLLLIIFWLIFISIKQHIKIKNLENEINKTPKLKPLDQYDLMQDDQNIIYCLVHKNPITQTGPMGYSEGSYWCSECKMWYEKKTKEASDSFLNFFND